MKNKALMHLLLPIFEEYEDFLAAYLFGSRADSDPSPDSDVDIGVLFNDRVSLEWLVRIQNAIEEALGHRTDVVDLRAASSYLALDIVRGRRFLCTDEFRCDEFELFVLARAGDLAPFERQRRAALLGVEA